MQQNKKVINIDQGKQKMPSKNGYVMAWRDIKKQPWYGNPEALAVFTHIMLSATSKPLTFDMKGVECDLSPGQYVTTYPQLAKVFDLSKSKVRSILKTFAKNGQIVTTQIKQGRINKGLVITLTGWSKWQKNTDLLITPPNTPHDTRGVTYLKGCDTPLNTPPNTPLSTVLNNNVLNNNNKSMLVSDEKSERVCHLEIREKAFEHFWQTWSKCKKLVGKINTAPKSTTKTKFLSMLNDKHVEKIGVDGFRKELGLMCELAIGAHTDIAENKDSSFRAYQNMYPAKFLTNKQWRDCAEYRELSK